MRFSCNSNLCGLLFLIRFFLTRNCFGPFQIISSIPNTLPFHSLIRIKSSPPINPLIQHQSHTQLLTRPNQFCLLPIKEKSVRTISKPSEPSKRVGSTTQFSSTSLIYFSSGEENDTRQFKMARVVVRIQNETPLPPNVSF